MSTRKLADMEGKTMEVMTDGTVSLLNFLLVVLHSLAEVQSNSI